MILSEKRKTEKYRKRLRLSYLIIFILSLWLIRKYNDFNYIETDKEMLEYDIINKDSEIFKLRYQVDSLSKPKEEVIIKEQVPVKIKRTVPDTTNQIPKVIKVISPYTDPEVLDIIKIEKDTL
jgi:hypothetical protein